MQRNRSFPAWLFILGIFGLLLIFQLRFNRPEAEQIAFQQAMTLIKEGQVTEMQVADNQMLLTLETGELYEAYKPVEDSYVDLYAFYGVEQQDLVSIDIQETNRTTWDNLMSVFISVGSVLLLIWIFTSGFRRRRR